MTLAIYSVSRSWGYVYEDRWAPQAWEGIWAWASRATDRPNRSLTALVWHLVGEATAYAPIWQRATSLGLHLVNGLLLWTLARRLGLLGAVVATGVFLLHPLQIEAVAAVAYRSDLLIGLCLLLALVCAERGWGIPAWIAAASAAGAKEAGVVALGLVPLWAWGRRLPTWTATTSMLWAVACGPIVLLGLDWIREQHPVWASLSEMGLTLSAWMWLLGQWVVPAGLTIDPDWAVRVTPIVSAGAACVWALALASQSRMAWFVAMWSLIALAPRLLWQTGEGLHEHHVYATAIVLSLWTGALVAGKRGV